ncbi:DUF11 domain-containing protein [Rhizorhabdus dicambivorans]|uniref:DUF11 domain-containing protein n=2 Tax=Rhizorhabdus dicambivorans TaxID=1850238 RepID=A0A2A4FSV4_9SPHN|nr:DUF11 domain-containing protein [Rhizorhabdus dicambivorans]PCE40776.1 DUF11 domain-containing protein [Rhizorhabdus dicambivorans]
MAAGAGTISNTATLSFGTGGARQQVQSNTVTLVPTGGLPASVRFMRLPAAFAGKLPVAACGNGRLTLNGDGLSEPGAGAYTDSESYAANATVLVELTNPSGNLDPGALDRSRVAIRSSLGDVEHLALTETAPDSGVFTGAIGSRMADAVPQDCELQTYARETITVDFDGAGDTTNNASDTALIDPYGFVFDSLSGRPIDGATVRLVDADSGQPARVFGDDGVSPYPSTVVSGQAVTDGGGAVYAAESGRYRFPLVMPGRYRIVVEPPPGYSAPSRVSPDQLASLEGPGGVFIVSDASYARGFALVDLDPLQVDIPVDPSGGPLTLDKIASVRTASPGDAVQYRLRLANRDGSEVIPGVTITDLLPPGMRYRKGSTRGVAEPEVGADGRSLTFRPGVMRPGASLEIRYSVTIVPGAPVGEALNRAIATDAGGARSAAGSAAVRIRPLLNSDALTIVGRVSEGGCGVTGAARKGVADVRLLMEDGTYVVTDRDGLYHFEGIRKGRHVVQLDSQSLKGGYRPIVCDDDSRAAGSAISRFVEGQGGTLQRVDFALVRAETAATAEQAAPVVADDASAAGNGIDWLDWAGEEPGVDWLFPMADHNPRAPVLRVVIKHLRGQAIDLRLNGAPVDALARDQGDGNGRVVIAKWTGLPLKEGDNLLEARVIDASGRTTATLTRTVHYANSAVRAEYLRERSSLAADGIGRPLIAVRLLDRDGRPVRKGTPVAFQIEAPYMAAVEAAAQEQKPLAGLGRGAPTARVGDDEGVALIALEPTTQAGAARLVLSFADGERTRTQEIRPWLEAAAREWVVVGFGAGTVGHSILSGKARRAGALGRSDSFADGQLAFYAKGRIRGSWLLTMAYDSARKADRDRGLLGTIDPDRYYTVYGDGTSQGHDAATSGKLYLRLERRQFYALYGDYRTDLSEAQLTRFNRTLNGFKGEFRGRVISFTGFAANSEERHVRDEIQGNGLTGPYRLRGRQIVPNSEQVRIETRDRFRSDVIVGSQYLTRHIDYDIDGDNGTLIFKAPVLSRDPDGHPNFIVVDYELYGTGAKRLVAGGRAAVALLGGKVEAGATMLRDETSGTATVGGVDVRAKIAVNTELRVEAAAGGVRGGSGNRAYVAEIEHHDARIDLTAYVRQQDQDYGVGQQNVVEAGTRKIGADGRIRLSRRIAISAAAWHQQSLTGPARRDAIDARAEWRGDGASFHAGVKIADDRGVGNIPAKSRLIALGGSKELFGGRLLVAAENQFALGGDRASTDFPVRRTVDAGYRLSDAVRLIGGYEMAKGERASAQGIRAGFDVTPWAGGKLTTTLNRESVGESGPRAFAQFGMAQSLPIGAHWTVDGSLDSSRTVKGRIAPGQIVNPLHPVASGGSIGQDGPANEDYSAVSLGVAWQSGGWSWNGRAEHRRGDATTRWGVASNLLRRLGGGRTIASSLRWYRIANRDGAVAAALSADLAVAWRPIGSRWSLLNRTEFRHERGDGRAGSGNLLGVPTANGADALSSRIINNLAINWRDAPEGAEARWEAALYHGVKYVKGRFDDDRFDGLIDVIGFDLRRDLGRRFDIGISGSVQHSWKDKAVAWSAGPAVGVSPADNMWISLGYNVKGFHDRDFEEGRYLRQGPYVTLRLKFDQQSLARLGRRFG